MKRSTVRHCLNKVICTVALMSSVAVHAQWPVKLEVEMRLFSGSAAQKVPGTEGSPQNSGRSGKQAQMEGGKNITENGLANGE